MTTRKTAIRLKSSKDWRFSGTFSYLIHYDYGAGRKDRYEVLILTADAPVVIGRELDLKTVRKLIATYEYYAPETWYGDHQTAHKTMERIVFMLKNGNAVLH